MVKKLFLFLIIFTFLLTTAALAVNHHFYDPVEYHYFNTGDSSERRDNVPVYDYDHPNYNDWYVIYRAKVWGIDPDDLFQLYGDFEVTNDLNINVRISSMIIVDTDTDPNNGYVAELCEAQSTNFDSDVHHLAWTRTGAWISDRDTSYLYFLFVARAGSSQADTGDELTVEQDYGRLWGVKIRED